MNKLFIIVLFHMFILQSLLLTLPLLFNPPNAPNKQDAIVDEPSKDPKTIAGKFCDCLKNYKAKTPLEDFALEGMTVEEFWQHGNKGMTIEEWYYLACVYELNFVEANIPGDIFNTLDSDLNVKLAELHTVYHL
jgi:hypothetical protein